MITLQNLTKIYGGVKAVNDVSLTIPDGELWALVGTSGCGKSTTLRMVNRLIEPSSGSIQIDGVDVMAMNPQALRLGIGYVIQGIGLFPHRTIAENIATVPRLLGWKRGRIAERVDELLHLFSLAPGEFARKYPHQLSGGQQQRVGVARALAAEPPILLMDEPFGALDPITRARLQMEFAQIQKRQKITVIFVTHDMDEAFLLGDRIAVMDKGRVLQVETPENLLRRPQPGFVSDFIGLDDRVIRLLSLRTVDEAVRPAAPGRWREADGAILDGTTGKPVAPVRPGDTMREAASRIIWENTDVLPAVDAGGHVVGEVLASQIWAQGSR
ncbi:osmoprotectant transport system ATP-binding protein [Faunimonas pinastri]|uniref:Osmoprotectant transport system ATP-binding protein n=1 Tax=Faunimonas pinastri TaxID=1855383 RepID=A0A1H9AND8_9HYPH|nr:ABC transporter ATP-binding protein [Faunimonas pinastri]SEP78179.1 osmoprotectant transport system ATP-binding protein [Faunimonas pinastri]